MGNYRCLKCGATRSEMPFCHGPMQDENEIEIERLRTALAWLDDYVLDVGGAHNGERGVKKIQQQQAEIERLRAALKQIQERSLHIEKDNINND